MLAKTFSKHTDLSPAYIGIQGGFFIDCDGKRFILLLYLQAQAFDLPTTRSSLCSALHDGFCFPD